MRVFMWFVLSSEGSAIDATRCSEHLFEDQPFSLLLVPDVTILLVSRDDSIMHMAVRVRVSCP
jgi:hypothetical protein